MLTKEVELEPIPSAFRANGDEHTRSSHQATGLGDGRLARRIGDESGHVADERIQIVLDEDAKLLVRGDDRHARIPRLLKAFNEQREMDLWIEKMCVEVVALDAFSVGQHDSTDAERGDLRPQATQHLRAGKGDQQIDPRASRRLTELTPQRHASVIHRDDDGATDWTIENADANLLTRRNGEDVSQMTRAVACQVHNPVGANFDGFKRDEVHGLLGRWRGLSSLVVGPR